MTRPLINYVSSLPRDLRSGGFSAMNAAARAAVERAFQVHYVGPINPPPSLPGKAWSKIRRLAGIGGVFYFFSQARLDEIARQVERGCDPGAVTDFFHGFTPWSSTRPARPYLAYSDCTFRDYVGIYHDRSKFTPQDLARIESAESVWLRGARAIAFSSRWAADRAIGDYGLASSRVMVVGSFGEIAPPERDSYAGGQDFVFVSTDFAAKGGPAALEAFARVRAHNQTAGLVVVGDHPAAAAPPGVTFTGFLRKEDAGENRRLREILARARAILHPTLNDIAPLCLVEAGYFGCPAISSRHGAIPELVEDGVSGLLVNPRDTAEITGAMEDMLRAGGYAAMRQAAWRKSRDEHSQAAFEQRLLAILAALPA